VKYSIGDAVMFDNIGGKPKNALVVEIDQSSGNPYHILVPYIHKATKKEMHMHIWVNEDSLSIYKTEEEIQVAAYDHAMRGI